MDIPGHTSILPDTPLHSNFDLSSAFPLFLVHFQRLGSSPTTRKSWYSCTTPLHYLGILNTLSRRFIRHFHTQCAQLDSKLEGLKQIEAARKDNFDKSYNDEISYAEFSDELSDLCDREQKIIWSVVPKLDAVCDVLAKIQCILREIGGVLGETVVAYNRGPILQAMRHVGPVQGDLQDKQDAILDKAKRIDELWLESLKTGQEVKDIAKELGENEGVVFGPGDVVDPIFSGTVDDQGGSTDEGDDVDMDAESESDG